MATFYWILLISLLGSLGSVTLSASVLLIKEETRKKLMPGLLSFATGTLLGAAFLGMLPEVSKQLPASDIFLWILIGLLIFFSLEKFVLWRHCHDEHCDEEKHHAEGSLILIGDAFHNFADGIMIAATFLHSIPLGIAAAIAIILHEIPQEIGDFAILLESGFSTQKAFLYNALSSLSALVGALLGFVFLKELQELVPYVLTISAASFIYISIGDLFPNLHRHTQPLQSLLQFLLILLGIFLMAFLIAQRHGLHVH